MKTGTLHGIVASSKTRVRCIFCGVHIPKANKCIEQHVNGGRHKENIELMLENGISFNGESLFCKVCNDTAVIGDDYSVLKHIVADEHDNRMAALEDLVEGEFINLEDYLSSDKDEVYCEACKSSIKCTLSGLEEHVNSFNHRMNLAEKLKPLNGLFPVENGELYCKVCDAYIENTVQSILDHIDEDEQHISWFSDIENLLEDQGISIDNYLKVEEEQNAYCAKCNTHFQCTSQSIEDHILTEAHLNQITEEVMEVV